METHWRSKLVMTGVACSSLSYLWSDWLPSITTATDQNWKFFLQKSNPTKYKYNVVGHTELATEPLVAVPRQTLANMRRKLMRNCLLQRGYRNGFSVELMYPIHVTVVIRRSSTHEGQSATTTKQMKYGRKQMQNAPMMTPSCLAALTSLDRLFCFWLLRRRRRPFGPRCLRWWMSRAGNALPSARSLPVGSQWLGSTDDISMCSISSSFEYDSRRFTSKKRTHLRCPTIGDEPTMSSSNPGAVSIESVLSRLDRAPCWSGWLSGSFSDWTRSMTIVGGCCDAASWSCSPSSLTWLMQPISSASESTFPSSGFVLLSNLRGVPGLLFSFEWLPLLPPATTTAFCQISSFDRRRMATNILP